MMHGARLWPSLQPWIVRIRGREHNSPDPVLGLCLDTSNRYFNTSPLAKMTKPFEATESDFDNCRNIPITLVDLQKGETKAHACANAW